MKVTILNSAILTSTGEFKLSDISLSDAKELIKEGFTSAIGHESTAEIITTLLETEVKMNRMQFAQEVGQVALIFKLLSRPEEGKILTIEEIEKIGYKFQKLERNL